MTNTDYEKVGIAIMLLPSENVGADHLTLGFYGTTDNTDLSFQMVRNAAQQVRRAWKIFAGDRKPSGVLNGNAILNLGNEKYAYVGLVDSKDVEFLRARLVYQLTPRTEHGFLPHMTFGYAEGIVPIISSKEDRPVVFDRLRASFGNETIDLEF